MIRKRLLSGGIWALTGRGIGIISGLTVNALLARLLSPEEMGAYFLTMSVAVVASTLGQFGMPPAVVRFVAESLGRDEQVRARKVVLSAMVICVLAGGVMSLIYAAGLGTWISNDLFHSDMMHKVTTWISVLLFILVLQGLLAEVFRGFHDIKLASLLGNVSTSLFSALAFFVLWVLNEHGDIRLALQLSTGAAALTVVVSLLMLFPRLGHLHGKGTITMKELMRTGWPLCVSSVTVLFAVQGDLWVVGAMLGERDAAVYGATLRLLAMMTMFHGLVVSVVQSTVAELHGQGNPEKIQQIVQNAAFWACLLAGGVFLGFVLLGKPLLGWVFGDIYRQGYVLLLILALGQFSGMLLGPAGMVMMMTGHQQAMMWIIVINASVGLVLAMILAPYFGLMGVAISWSIASLLQGGSSWWIANRTTGIHCHASWRVIRDKQRIET